MNAGWITLQGDRAVLEMGQQILGDANVVVDDLGLGEAGLGIEELFQVGDGDVATVNGEVLFGFLLPCRYRETLLRRDKCHKIQRLTKGSVLGPNLCQE